MFTGIIIEKGKVSKVAKNKNGIEFRILSKTAIKNKKTGESIAVNGACMTITKIDKDSFTFTAISESLAHTNLIALKNDDEVNLEPALTIQQSLDGHLLSGHIDTTSETVSLENNKITFKLPSKISGFTAYKGSISINGVSLTISDLQEDTFSVDLIPKTIKETNLGKLKKGDIVNIEVDLIARYIGRLLENKEKEAKYEFLKERNLI